MMTSAAKRLTIQQLNTFKRSLSTSKSNQAWFFSKDKEKSAGHSSLISKDAAVYEIVTESVIPSKWDDYVGQKANIIQAVQADSQIKVDHLASWNVATGDSLFTAIHLFEDDNWSDVDTARKCLKENQEYQTAYRASWPMLSQQHVELTKAFSFWPSPDKRPGDNVYDIRSYNLKPGSMYDWSNYWARGIKHRSTVSKDAPYAGLFTQLGELHTIFHIWCYKSLADRKQCREGTWVHPEWNDIVANTVPLVKTMKTVIVEPLPFSPTK